ncbi:helix-turn-helix transcriptional regulator [Micromonospora sp. CA-240977]|uniref:helix-turn-helix transcriptional regulator n=1 Tax=Micromonospora sp. CA-240977 TaxID=3239957 RepID=UPI003D8E1A29
MTGTLFYGGNVTSTTHFARRELGAFLRSRRNRLRPELAGIGVTGQRRTPGLRREEVARLAGVSITWYTWLEQGRNIRVSRQVLASIARALFLNPVERDHLFLLAGERAPTRRTTRRAVSADTLRFVELLGAYPCWVFDRYFDILTWNDSGAALLVDIEGRPEHELNALWLLFHEPRARQLLVDWEDEARRLVALLRGELAANTGDARYREMVRDLGATSPTFRRFWETHDVVSFTSSVRRFNHPRVGRMALRSMKLDLVNEPGHSLMVYFADPGTADLERLHALTGLSGPDGGRLGNGAASMLLAAGLP